MRESDYQPKGEGVDRQRLPSLGLHIADAQLHRAEPVVRAHRPPDLREVMDAVGVEHELVVASVFVPGAENVRDAAAREHAHERLRARRVQLRPHSLDEGGVGREGKEVRQVAAHSVAKRDRPVLAVHAHVHVRTPRVVAPGHVLEPVFHQPVVRRVDDALVLPAREGMRAGRPQRHTMLLGKVAEREAA